MSYRFPPIAFLFFRDSQPTKAAWQTLRDFGDTWNSAHVNRFVREEDDQLSVEFAAGVEDPELAELDEAIAVLKRTSDIRFFKGVDSPFNGPDALEHADFILAVGEGAPSGFLMNEIEAFGPPIPCSECAEQRLDGDRPVRAPLMIDERTLPDEGSFDVLNMANGTSLVSKKTVELLSSQEVTGYRVSEVMTAQGTPSENYFLFSADAVLLDPCGEHTPRDEGAICGSCGARSGFVMGHVHVSDGQIQALSFFSMHRFGHASLYMAREVFHLLKSSGVSIFASVGINTCHHDDDGTRLHSAASPEASEPPPLQGWRGFLSHLDDPRPQFVCGARGGQAPTRTFDVEHLIQPAPSSAALDAAERTLPELQHLRPLFESANGALLYCQVGCTPEKFPSLAAMRRGEADDPSMMRLLPMEECLPAQAEMREQIRDFDIPFIAADGMPFAQLTASSDVLVCHEGAIYYFSPMYNRYHNQRIGKDLDEAFTRIFSDPARFLMDTAAVATFYDEQGLQYYPQRYQSGAAA